MAGSGPVEDVPTRAVGPYLLQRTLGKGQTGMEEGAGSGPVIRCNCCMNVTAMPS